jgi:hypothetical protein
MILELLLPLLKKYDDVSNQNVMSYCLAAKVCWLSFLFFYTHTYTARQQSSVVKCCAEELILPAVSIV